MLYAGMTDEAIKVVAAARDRHDGLKRNPFDEAECGHHYARAMASWACYLAATGFGYDGVTKTMRFGSPQKPTSWFWSTGDAWGVAKMSPQQDGTSISMTVMGGSIKLARVDLSQQGGATLEAEKELREGDHLDVLVSRDA
jgi:hypothetical protein